MPDFLIEVFSPVWIAWNLLIFAVVFYDQFMLLFSLAFGFKLTGKFLAVDLVCFCLLVADIFMRSKTAITHPKRFCYDKDLVLDYYVNTWLILDIFAALPFCYFLMIDSEVKLSVIALSRLPRLLKIFRAVETFRIIEFNTDVPIQMLRVI